MEVVGIARKPKVVEKPLIEEIKIECARCGKTKKELEYFLSKWSKVWNINNKRVPICKDCIQELMDEYTKRFDEKTALAICCAYLDIPYYETLYKSIRDNNSFFNVGLYIRQLQMRQHQYKSFQNSLTEGELMRTESEVKEIIESRWSKRDKQNMNFAISVVGYDPFDDCCLTENDRKYSFNVLSGYCDIDGIKDDSHKLQACVQITQNQLQIKKLDELLNQELLASKPDENVIKSLTTAKKQLQDSVARIAQDNNLSSAYNNNSSVGKNTLSKKMKEMLADGYEAIRVNLYDIKTSEAMKQIADLSNQSIIEQLTWDSNDYTEMIKEQRAMILKLQSDNETLTEENRMVKNELLDLKDKKKK